MVFGLLVYVCHWPTISVSILLASDVCVLLPSKSNNLQVSKLHAENVQLLFRCTNLNNVAVVTFSRHIHIILTLTLFCRGAVAASWSHPRRLWLFFKKYLQARVYYFDQSGIWYSVTCPQSSVHTDLMWQLLTIVCFVFISLESTNFKQVQNT